MFQSLLARLTARAGARWAMVVGNDGILLETDNAAFRPQAEALAAEYAAFFRASRKAVCETDMGPLLHSQLATEQAKVLFQALTPDYFLAVCLETEAHTGKALFEISKAAESLAQELVF